MPFQGSARPISFAGSRLAGLDQEEQGLSPLRTESLVAGFPVERLGEGESRQIESESTSLPDRDAEILDEVVDEEARLEIAVQHSRHQIRERPTSRGPGGDRVEHPSWIEPRAGREEHRLDRSHHRGRHEHLIDDLRALTRPRAALMDHGPAQYVEDRLRSRDRRRLPADHDRERSTTRPDVATRDRGVEERDAPGRRGVVQSNREVGFAGRHVDQDPRRMIGRQRSGLPQVDHLDILGVADDGHRDVRRFRGLARRIGPDRPPLDEGRRLRPGSGVDPDPMSRLQEVTRHRGPHDAASDPTDLHVKTPRYEDPAPDWKSRSTAGTDEPGWKRIVLAEGPVDRNARGLALYACGNGFRPTDGPRNHPASPHTAEPIPMSDPAMTKPPTREDTARLEAEVDAACRPFQQLQEQMHRVIVGQQELLDGLLVGLLANGHLLIEGVPGLAKTTAISSLARGIRTGFKRIQFTPDLLPADLVGTLVYRPSDGDFVVKTGPIFSNLVLADEINRAPAKVQSALLEAMQERQVTIGDETHPLPEPFMVLATQNPIEQEGTYPLPEAQVDRFLMKLVVRYPDRGEERRILDRMAKTATDLEVEAVIEPADIVHARSLIDRIHVDDRIRDYVVDLVVATREPGDAGLRFAELLDFGASPRATIALVLVAKARAFLAGRGYVVPQDVKDAAPDVLRHRLGLSYEAEAEERTADDLISEMLDHVPVP